jgi:hypothetical protein
MSKRTRDKAWNRLADIELSSQLEVCRIAELAELFA